MSVWPPLPFGPIPTGVRCKEKRFTRETLFCPGDERHAPLRGTNSAGREWQALLQGLALVAGHSREVCPTTSHRNDGGTDGQNAELLLVEIRASLVPVAMQPCAHQTGARLQGQISSRDV